MLIVLLFVAIIGAIFYLFFENSFRIQSGSSFTRLEAKPRAIQIEAGEGERVKAEFDLKNTGKSRALINIYKTEESTFQINEDDGKIEKLLSRKNLAEAATEEDLKKAADFSGAPWVVYSPYYAILEPGESLPVRLSFDTTNLSVGDHATQIIIIGTRKEELKIIPVELVVRKAPKLKVSKIEIDDGFSEDTTGDQNHVAGPGEKVALAASITNEGGMTAKDIVALLSFEDPLIKNFGDGTAKISSIESGQTEKVRFIFEVGTEFSSEFPPSAVLEMSDGSGKKWSDNFYLGEEGSFKYPTGLMEEETKSPEHSSLGR